MSVSVLDRPVSVSPTADTLLPHPKPAAKASLAAPSYAYHDAGNVNVGSSKSQSGLVFGEQSQPAHHHHAAHHSHPSVAPNPASHQGMMQQLHNWLGQWYGGHRPPMNAHGPHPFRPGKPDATYAQKSNDQLAQSLLENFKAFTGSPHSMSLSSSSIRDMAQKSLGWNPAMNQNIRLARELMRRPDLMDALDRNPGTGALDGQIDKQQLGQIIGDANPYKYKNDKQIAQEMLIHFNQLKERFGGREININDLKTLASRPLTGNPAIDHLIQLGQAAVARSYLMTKMDNLFSNQGDGLISRNALRKLSR
jgi:hypothetical protein